jgi:hypothetical protein
MVGEGKGVSVEYTDPFIAAVSELESPVIGTDDFGEIIVEIVIVVYGSFSCHTVHLLKK